MKKGSSLSENEFVAKKRVIAGLTRNLHDLLYLAGSLRIESAMTCPFSCIVAIKIIMHDCGLDPHHEGVHSKKYIFVIAGLTEPVLDSIQDNLLS
jgi:hypothetical protein